MNALILKKNQLGDRVVLSSDGCKAVTITDQAVTVLDTVEKVILGEHKLPNPDLKQRLQISFVGKDHIILVEKEVEIRSLVTWECLYSSKVEGCSYRVYDGKLVLLSKNNNIQVYDMSTKALKQVQEITEIQENLKPSIVEHSPVDSSYYLIFLEEGSDIVLYKRFCVPETITASDFAETNWVIGGPTGDVYFYKLDKL